MDELFANAEEKFVDEAVNILGEMASTLRGLIISAAKFAEAEDVRTLAVLLDDLEADLMVFVNQQNEMIGNRA